MSATIPDLSVALMRTALTHFVDHSEYVEKGTDKYAFVDDLHYAIEQYFEENAVPLHVTDIHQLHSALELEGYNLMYSGVSSSVIQDPNRTGLVLRGFALNLPDEEELSEGDEDDEDEEEEELTEAEEEDELTDADEEEEAGDEAIGIEDEDEELSEAEEDERPRSKTHHKSSKSSKSGKSSKGAKSSKSSKSKSHKSKRR
jgi:hypothetical protein